MNAIILALALLAAGQVSKEDIKKLTAAGISDEVILSYVKANGGVARLSAEDVVELKQAGASEKLLTSILSNSAPSEQRVVERPVQNAPAPTTTTYVDSTPYYYTPSPVYASDYYYPSTYYYPYYSYYPRSYYYSSCYPRSYYYSSCYPRYYSSGVSVGYYGGRSYGRGSVGVSVYRR
ncbi:MAG TPA: hypothetical protein VNM14_12080 [Planctomycetota bacterium]|jgi:hypothetical protein|nr:hypothetical protein [Planctomycetota bacterium]